MHICGKSLLAAVLEPAVPYKSFADVIYICEFNVSSRLHHRGQDNVRPARDPHTGF